jgi:ribosomal protein S18 acetylase RimI-like enzyme
MIIRRYHEQDQQAVIGLWEVCGLIRPWNDPCQDIARKLTVQPELFLVGMEAEQLVGTVMAGFDGHRGWVNYLAVAPQQRRLAYGKQLMQEAERLLRERGCPKLNLQVRTGNADVIEFYHKLGYVEDELISLGKRLIAD